MHIIRAHVSCCVVCDVQRRHKFSGSPIKGEEVLLRGSTNKLSGVSGACKLHPAKCFKGEMWQTLLNRNLWRTNQLASWNCEVLKVQGGKMSKHLWKQTFHWTRPRIHALQLRPHFPCISEGQLEGRFFATLPPPVPGVRPCWRDAGKPRLLVSCHPQV